MPSLSASSGQIRNYYYCVCFEGTGKMMHVCALAVSSTGKMLCQPHLFTRLASKEITFKVAHLIVPRRHFHHFETVNSRRLFIGKQVHCKLLKTSSLRWCTTTSSTNENLITNEMPPSISESAVTKDEVVTTDAAIPTTPSASTDNFSTETVTEISNVNVGEAPTLSDIISGVGEPSLISQGLGGWAPSGIAQTYFDFFHRSLDAPWWLAIAIGTCIVRFCLSPLIVISQRNAARFNNHMPQMQMLQLKMTEARKCGNAMMSAKYANDMAMFMKEKNLNPLKSMVVPMAQIPIFVSVFFGLRGMANAPIESMKTGGMLWFENLTVVDPYYILPLMTCATLFFTIELGAEGGVNTGGNQLIRYVLRAMPVVIFPFIMNFPAALLCYWLTSNLISLCQVAIFKIQPVRRYFNIEPMIRHDSQALPLKPKGFVNDFKDSWDNQKVMRKLAEREEFDKLQFRKAGIGPIQKTYPFDPTKQTAKLRDKH